jgi:protocatechuate 3,4-dioxygenase beta subunit
VHKHECRESAITEQVIASFDKTPDPRLRTIMQALIKHVHAFVSEIEPNEHEWGYAIDFLTRTGHMCDGLVRQEFILLSDTLGISMLVDAINHRHASATESTVFGPFYMSGMPERKYGENMAVTPGTPALIHGHVTDVDGQPIEGAILDVWQTAENGMYSGQDKEQELGNLRGRYQSDAQGCYAIRTILPVSYSIPDDGPVGEMLHATARHPWRPPHVHFMVDAPCKRKLVTHLFAEGGGYLGSDAVFGVKPSLIVQFKEGDPSTHVAKAAGLEGSFREAVYDFVLPPP